MTRAGAKQTLPPPAAPPAEPAAPPAPAPVESPLHRIRAWELTLVVGLCLALLIPLLGESILWDPWETHYAEVARRMLEDQDWVRLNWGEEGSFHSKPVLTFWMMAASMKLLGVGDEGGFSGEFATSSRVVWALRLPFALWGVFGLSILWLALARLHSKRAAWLATVILASCPYYFMISRQAITDMPSCAMLVGSMALLALAIFDDAPLRRWRFGITAHHAFVVVFAALVLPQLFYFTFNLDGNRWMISRTLGIPGPWMMVPFYAGVVGVSVWSLYTCKTRRQAYMYWFYLLNGIAVLAKGPVAPALAGLTIIGYLVVTGDWKLLAKLEIPRGVMVAAIVCLPWHFAIFMKDGLRWLKTYVSYNLIGRAFTGVFGERGTFQYFFGQLGPGMWPWACFLPGALVALALGGRARTREEKLRAMFTVWAILAFAFFAFVQTKFHHYVLPAVPALAVVAALWLDDVWAGRARGVRIAVAVAAALFLVTSIDVVSRQERLVALFTYRYDRPWPYAAPWSIDFSGILFALAMLFGAGLLLLAWGRTRRVATMALCALGLAFAVFGVDAMQVAAADHWGQGKLFAQYYGSREIHGADLTYYGGEALVRDWETEKDFEVRSVIPQTLKVGDPMTISWELRNASEVVTEHGELAGSVARIDAAGNRFSIAVPAAEREKIAPIVAANRGARDGKRRFVAVNADRMIAWNQYWRGENFDSGGEIWNQRLDDMHTVFSPYNDGDNSKLAAYLKARLGQGKKYWVVTERGRLDTLRKLLPTETAKTTLQAMDRTSNKFELAKFTLDEKLPPAR